MSTPSANTDLYRALVEHSPEATYVVRDGFIVFANPAAVRLFGAPSAEVLIGMTVLDRIHPDDHALALARRKQGLELNVPAPLVEMRFVALDGRIFEVEVQATAIEFGGPATYAAARDITARRTALCGPDAAAPHLRAPRDDLPPSARRESDRDRRVADVAASDWRECGTHVGPGTGPLARHARPVATGPDPRQSLR